MLLIRVSQDPLLDVDLFDQLTFIFVVTMQFDCTIAIQTPLDCNPPTQMWRHLYINQVLKHMLSKYLKLAKLMVMVVLGNVEDEHIFLHLLSWNKLRN
jgi:hypothetical protein